MNTPHDHGHGCVRQRLAALLLTSISLIAGCDRSDGHGEGGHHDHPHDSTHAPTPTNRVDIPEAVRRNLGVAFAKVEYRAVSRTLRFPGRFELPPTARRECRTPVGGTIELLVSQYQRVEAGTPLYRVDSAAWRDLSERIVSVEAKVASMGPLREAHRLHEQALEEKVTLWRERLRQLEELRVAGGGGATQLTEARTTLTATQADLADVMEKDAALEAEQKQAEAELRSLQARRDQLRRVAGQAAAIDVDFVVHAPAAGVVESLLVTPGGLIEEHGHVLTMVQPERLRFRATALQADLGRLRDGLACTVVPPQGGTVTATSPAAGELRIGLAADPVDRTIDLMMEPTSPVTWAKAGVAAHLEVTLEGGGEELAIPLAAVVRDGATPHVFRRDPKNPDRAIRLEADLGVSDGRWISILSGVKEGDEVVVSGHYQLMLALSGTATKGGHFHADGTFHAEEH